MIEGFDTLAAAPRQGSEDNVARSPWLPERELTWYEQPAAFVAATYGQLTGRPGVCISALGPGMLNFCFISKDPS